MTIRLIALAVVAGALVTGPAAAQTLDAASQEALGAVLQMLRDPALRAAAIANNPGAAAADRQLRALAGDNAAVTQELFDLAGQVFEDLATGSGGNATAIDETLTRGQSDPAGFAAMLSPRTLERLRALSIKLSDQPKR